MINFEYRTLETCAQASGLVIVIDVIRAFTTATYAFEAGVSQIALVGEVEEAFALRERWPEALIMGEVDGLKVPGFDFGNSPTALQGLDLSGQRLIQRTTSGTQGVVRSVNAAAILTASFANAQATATYALNLLPTLNSTHISFVITGQRNGIGGDEDAACADYLQALLSQPENEPPPVEPYLQRVRDSKAGRLFLERPDADRPRTDLTLCTTPNRFPHAMRVSREKGLHLLRPVASV